jgi:hypothetical protein
MWCLQRPGGWALLCFPSQRHLLGTQGALVAQVQQLLHAWDRPTATVA